MLYRALRPAIIVFNGRSEMAGSPRPFACTFTVSGQRAVLLQDDFFTEYPLLLIFIQLIY